MVAFQEMFPFLCPRGNNQFGGIGVIDVFVAVFDMHHLTNAANVSDLGFQSTPMCSDIGLFANAILPERACLVINNLIKKR